MKNKNNLEKEILEYWENQAIKYGSDNLATVPDTYLKEIELKSIFRFLKDNVKMIDIGCGNGFTCFEICKKFNLQLKGIDYAHNMIREAKKKQNQLKYPHLTFTVDNTLNLHEKDNFYDIALSERVIINIPTWEKQKQSIKEIYRVLKKGGIYIMAEAFQEPFKNLNELRELVNLYTLKNKFHNRYLKGSELFSYIKDLFKIKHVDNFCSLYFLLTRIVSPKIGEIEGKETGYLDPINQVAVMLPTIGDYGPSKTYVLEKI